MSWGNTGGQLELAGCACSWVNPGSIMVTAVNAVAVASITTVVLAGVAACGTVPVGAAAAAACDVAGAGRVPCTRCCCQGGNDVSCRVGNGIQQGSGTEHHGVVMFNSRCNLLAAEATAACFPGQHMQVPCAHIMASNLTWLIGTCNQSGCV